MAIMGLGEYSSPPPSFTTDGQHGRLQIDRRGSLKTYAAPSTDDSFNHLTSTSATYGKLPSNAVANNGSLWVQLSLEEKPCNYVDWVIACDVAWEYQLARALSPALTAKLTLADATAVDADDTFIFNAVTYTCKASGAVAASHEYNIGGDNATTAVNLTALLDGANGVPGATATVNPVAATDEITIVSDGKLTGMSAINFGQGTSASNEVAFSDLTATQAILQGALVTSMVATTSYKGYWIEQNIGGWPYALIKLTNKSGAAAANFEVRAIRR